MCCCILRNSQSARKLILFSDCFSLLFQLLVFFLPGIFALTTPLGIFAHIAPEKVCAVSVRKTVKLSTMGHFLALHTPNVHGPDHLLLIWPKNLVKSPCQKLEKILDLLSKKIVFSYLPKNEISNFLVTFSFCLFDLASKVI